MPVQNLNQVAVTGNLTKDPDLKETQSGTKVAELRIAVNSSIKKGDSWESKPNYFQVTAWGKTGENAAKYLSKGSPVAIAGRLEWQSWEAAEGGLNSRVVIIATNVQFLGTRDRSSEPSQVEDDSKKKKPAKGSKDEDDIPF